jgi:hypothetical protein
MPNLPDPVFSFLGSSITKSLFIMFVFAALMMLASLSMIRTSKPKEKSSSLSPIQRTLLIGLEGLVVGGVTGFVGAGGGFLIIPALVVLVGLPMKIAVGTSLFIIAAKSLLGFIGDLQQGIAVDWTLMFSISAIAIAGLLIGVKFSNRVSEKTLKKGFGFFVLFVGLIILTDQVRTILSAN